MKTFRTISVLALAVCVVPTVAMAGVHLVAPGMTPDPNNPNLFKTHPMSDGEVLVVPWAVHTKLNVKHWAGVRFGSHVLDSSEVDLTGIYIVPGLLPAQTIAGPQGGTTGVQATYWDPSAPYSGITMFSSVPFVFGQWTISARNTTPANNSDTDLSAWASSIIHLGSVPDSSWIVIPQSGYIWATSNFTPTPEEPFPENPPEPGDGLGHFVHLDFTVNIHVTPGFPYASGYYSIPIGTSFLGIDHVPAPGVGLMMLAGGYGALGARRRAGRRRLS